MYCLLSGLACSALDADACSSLCFPADKLLATINTQIPYEVTEELVCYYKPKTNAEPKVDHTFRAMPIFITHFERGDSVEHFYGLPQVRANIIGNSSKHSFHNTCNLPADQHSRHQSRDALRRPESGS